jgi:hypothetical protein
MDKLTSKQEAFVRQMTEGAEYARRGFDLLLQRHDFERFFDALSAVGLFAAEQNPRPVPGDKPGFYSVPYWEPLKYLEAVAKLSGERSDTILAKKVMNVLRRVSNWRDSDGAGRDNYHTYHAFARILGLVPITVVTSEDIELIPTWLHGRFDRSMVAFALAEGTLRRFIDSASPDDWRKACRIVEHCVSLRWVDDRWGGAAKTPVTVVDDFWLKRIIDATAGPLGGKAGRDAALIFLARLRETYSRDLPGSDSSISRPAIEDHPQNHTYGGPNNRLVEALRDVLLGWSLEDPLTGQAFVEDLLRDEAEIARRVGIHVLDARFQTMRGTYLKYVGNGLFSRGHLHELYKLLSGHFHEFTADELSATLNAIRAIAAPPQSPDPALALKYVQRQWLSAIKGRGCQEADDWYAELLADSTLGPPSTHPDFAVFTQITHGFGPTPYSVQELVAFARDASLVERLNAFTQPSSWDGPTTHSLVETLIEATAVDPETFLGLLGAFRKANRPYQYGVIVGLKKLWEAEGDTVAAVNWNDAWPELIGFFEELICGNAIWNETIPEGREFAANRDLIPPVIAEFLRAGTRKDEKAYNPALLPRGWELVKILVERSTSYTDPDNFEPMNQAINTPKGKAIEALIDHALRVCRISDNETGGHTTEWSEMAPVFDHELGKCHNGNYDFSTLAAAYVAHIHYMDQTWCARNLEKIFPVESPVNCRCALDGLSFASPSKPIYKLLQRAGVVDWALRHVPEQSRARENILQRLALAFLWGEETLDSPRFMYIFEGTRVGDMEQIAKYFWAVNSQLSSAAQREKVLAFWAECLQRSQNLAALPTEFFSTLSMLACYVSSIGECEESLMTAVAPHVGAYYNINLFLKELNRLIDTSPGATSRVLEAVVNADIPYIDFEKTLAELLKKLAARSETRLDAIRYVNRLGLMDLYRELTEV